MPKIITVFGATGNQGGSVIKHILADATLSKEFKIRAVTRDNSKPAAKALAKQGVELVNADLNSKDSVARAIQGSHTIFLVTNYWETMDPKIEVAQGKNVADAATEDGVSHIIFSSLLNVKETSKGKLVHVPHFDGKADIEKHIRSTGVPCTFILPGYFMSNFKDLLQKGEDGSYTLAYPTSDQARFPLFDAAEDTGKFVKAIIKSSRKLNGKQVLAATAYYTPKEIVSTISEVTGKSARFASVSHEQYMSFLPDAIAEEMLENHLFVESPGYYNGAELEASLEILEEKPTTWKEFLVKSHYFD